RPDEGRAAPEDLGAAPHPSGPDRRRVRPQTAGEDRPPHAAAQLRPHALRGRLQARGTAEGDRFSTAGENRLSRFSPVGNIRVFSTVLPMRRRAVVYGTTLGLLAIAFLLALFGVGEEAGKLTDWQAFVL